MFLVHLPEPLRLFDSDLHFYNLQYVVISPTAIGLQFISLEFVLNTEIISCV